MKKAIIASALAAAGMIASGVVAAKAIDYQGTIDIRPANGKEVGKIRGRVCNDLNRDAKCQNREPGISGVLVSDGLHVVTTNFSGDYELPLPTAEEEALGVAIFVTKPGKFDVPVNEDGVLPRQTTVAFCNLLI